MHFKDVGLFHDVLHYVWITLWNASNSQKIMHPYRKQPKRGETHIAGSYMPLSISGSASMKHLQEVGENLTFLSSSIYFRDEFGRHI